MRSSFVNVRGRGQYSHIKTPNHTLVSCRRGSLASPGGWGLCGCPWGDVGFFQLPARVPIWGCSGMKRATRSASSTEHAPKRNGGPGIIALCEGNTVNTKSRPFPNTCHLHTNVCNMNMSNDFLKCISMNSFTRCIKYRDDSLIFTC